MHQIAAFQGTTHDCLWSTPVIYRAGRPTSPDNSQVQPEHRQIQVPDDRGNVGRTEERGPDVRRIEVFLYGQEILYLRKMCVSMWKSMCQSQALCGNYRISRSSSIYFMLCQCKIFQFIHTTVKALQVNNSQGLAALRILLIECNAREIIPHAVPVIIWEIHLSGCY